MCTVKLKTGKPPTLSRVNIRPQKDRLPHLDPNPDSTVLGDTLLCGAMSMMASVITSQDFLVHFRDTAFAN